MVWLTISQAMTAVWLWDHRYPLLDRLWFW